MTSYLGTTHTGGIGKMPFRGGAKPSGRTHPSRRHSLSSSLLIRVIELQSCSSFTSKGRHGTATFSISFNKDAP
jgi:hypothetical protein